MLHVLVNTHSAESCAFRSDENREALLPAFDRLGQAAEQHGSTVKDMWANMASHTIFALIEAPDAHAVDAAVRDAGLVGLTDSKVFAVVPMETAVKEASK